VLKKQLGKRIATLRQTAKLTQAKLAEKCGYSIEFISLVERGINAAHAVKQFSAMRNSANK
jgi:transcriptional regulator with XRE-family HTH domain